MNNIPTLTTNRLVLRAPCFADWPAYQEMMGSARSVYMGGPFDQTAAWGMFCHGIALWSLTGYGALTIEHRQISAPLGQVEINSGPLFPEPELGWLLHQNAEGKGYAYEAACTLKQWAFDTARLCTLVSYIDPPNHRSCALAERLGGTLDPDAPKQDPTDLVYRYTAVAPQ